MNQGISSDAMAVAVRTPETDPDHDVIGRLWVGNGQIYYCDSYDSRIGYWMTNVADSTDRRNVSERAPMATFHPLRGQCGPSEIERGRTYYAANLGARPFKTETVTYDRAVAMRPPVFLFDSDRYAQNAAERAESAAKWRDSATKTLGEPQRTGTQSP